NLGLRNFVSGAQVGDQRLGGSDLAGRRGLFVQIADQADADSIFVDVVTAGVAAVNALFLAGPSLGDFDLSVAAAIAVADHEMVAAAIQSENLAVFRVDLVIVATGCGAMMKNDVPPGAVGLVGVDQLVCARLIQERLQALAQTGLANEFGPGSGGLIAGV